jgi:hypothetical protein
MYIRKSAHKYDDQFPGYRVEQPDAWTREIRMGDVTLVLTTSGMNYEVRHGVSNLWVVDLSGEREQNLPVDRASLSEVMKAEHPPPPGK